MVKTKRKFFYNTTEKEKKIKIQKRIQQEVLLQKQKERRAKGQKLKIIKLGKFYLKKTITRRRKKLKKVINFLNKKIPYSINIKITPNNIFCVLRDNKKNKTIILISAGILEIKVSKKKLKFVNKLLVQNFLNKIKTKIPQLQNKKFIVKISGPKKVIKFVSRQLISFLNKSILLMNALNKKVFNGCRAKKIRRKKHKGLRVFK